MFHKYFIYYNHGFASKGITTVNICKTLFVFLNSDMKVQSMQLLDTEMNQEDSQQGEDANNIMPTRSVGEESFRWHHIFAFSENSFCKRRYC